MRTVIFIIFIILILIALAFLAVVFEAPTKPAQESEVCFEARCFSVEIARSQQERATGLMFRESLDIDKGMLFIFEKEAIYPFWMKNTYIPLDIIWIDKNKQIIFISKNTQSCFTDNCPRITPDKKALYVLEINGGMSDQIGLSTGDSLQFVKVME